MSAKLRLYKEKLDGYKKFYSIVKTLKMVTMAKYRQVQGRVRTRDLSLRYSEKAFSDPEFDEDAVQKAATGTLMYIPVTTNRGSCGAMNSNSYRYVESILGSKSAYIPIGKKGQDSLSKLFPKEFKFSIINEMKTPIGFNYASYVWESSQSVPDIERTQIQFNRFVSASAQRQAVFNIPRYEKWLEQLNVAASGEDKRYSFANAILENDEEDVKDFYDFHASLTFLNALSENELSEQAARLVAVEGQLANLLQLQNSTQSLYNKTRQGSITASLIEILSAMSSLEGNAAKGVTKNAFWE